MSAAPVGATVRIYYDGAVVLVGDALRTPTGAPAAKLGGRPKPPGRNYPDPGPG